MKNRTIGSVLAIVVLLGLGMDLIAGCKNGSCSVSRRPVSVKARAAKTSRVALAKTVVNKDTQDKSEQSVKAAEETPVAVANLAEAQAAVAEKKDQSQAGILAKLATVWKKFTGLFS